MAALKGIDIDEQEETAFDRVQKRVEAKLRGHNNPEYVDLEDMGIGVKEW